MAQSWESKAIQKAGQEWQQAKRKNDKIGMARAAAKADQLRKQEGYALKGGIAKSRPAQTSKKYKTQKTGGILGIGAKSANQRYNVYASRLKEEQKSLTGSHGNVYAEQIKKDAAKKKKEQNSATEQAREIASDPRNPYNIRTGKGKVTARQEKQYYEKEIKGSVNRVKNTVFGAGKEYAASTGNAFLTANEATNRFLDKIETPHLTGEKMQDLLARHGAGTTPTALAKVRNPGYKEIDALHESAEKDLERAKQGLGAVGRVTVDIGSGVTQLAGDVLLGGGNALVPMAIRSFGGGASEARKDGASLSQQMVYGLGSAATEVLTEKLTNIAGPLKKVMGRGIGDKAVEDLIDRAAKSISKSAVGELVGKGVLRGAAGMVGEGLEEMISDVVNPVLKDMVYTDGETAKMKTPEFWKNTLYDGLIGAGVSGVLSGGGTVIKRATGANNQNGTSERVPVLGENGKVIYQKQSALNGAMQGKEKTGSTSYIKPETVSKGMENTYAEFIASTDEATKEFAQKAISGQASPKAKFMLTTVSEREANDLNRLLGFDVTGFKHNSRPNAFQHIEKEHGKNGLADHSMADMDDVARIPYVIENYDSVDVIRNADGDIETSKSLMNRDGTLAPFVKYTKRVDGHFYVVEAAPDTKRKSMELVSAYIEKANKKDPSRILDAEAPRRTSDNANGYLDPFKNTIPQNGAVVNEQNFDTASQGGAMINRATGANNQNGISERVPVLGENGKVSYPKQSALNGAMQRTEKTGSTSYIKPETVSKGMENTYAEFIASTDEATKEFAQKAISGQASPKAKFMLTTVSDREANDLNRLIGFDVTGFKHNSRPNAFQHIEKRHGKNGAQDHSMADMDDVSRIPYVLENYDSVDVVRNPDGSIKRSKDIMNRDNSHAFLVQYKKRVDGHFYVVEAVPDSSQKSIQLVSAYIQKVK